MLLDRLAGLDEAGLARVLANRADALDAPWPRRLEDLARRLSSPDSIVRAMRGLTKPGFQAMRAIRLLTALRGGSEFGPGEVATWLGAGIADVAPILDSLADRMLAWVDGKGRVRTPPSYEVIAVDFAGLGTSIANYLPQKTVEQLKTMTTTLSVNGDGRKGQIVDRMLEFFRDPKAIAALLETAPAGTQELLDDFAWNGPELECYLGDAYYHSYRGRRDEPEPPANWAAKRGLLWQTYEGTTIMPLEVGLALRGPDYRLPFAPHPPIPAVGAVSAEQVRAESSAAALRLIDRVCAVLDYSARQPISLIKSGRVGARAIKTLAKDTGSTVEEIRLAVELAIGLLMLAPAEPEPEPAVPNRKRASRAPVQPVPSPGLVPSERYAAWQCAGSAERLRSALQAWWTLPLAPLADEKVVRGVLGDGPSAAFTDVRQLTLRLIGQLPDGTGVRNADSLVELVGWHAPLVNPDLIGTLVTAALAEATLLGVIASGAAGELARVLVDRTVQRGHPALVLATDQLVAGARTSALFGADLTAVVTGPPDAALAGLLDRVADRESTGAASTWRFSPTSVRRAFDNGATAVALLDELRDVAQKPVPQPLEYLVNDVARRHGEVGVSDVGCVVVGDQPGLLAEIAVHRKLATLGLRAVAPTVLVAAGTAEATVAALRSAGYSPVRRDGDGAVTVRPAAERAAASIEAELVEPPPKAQDPREHAARLLRAPVRSSGRTTRGTLLDVLYREQGKRLTNDWMRFAWHLESGLPTRVSYLEPDGERRELVVSEAELHDDVIDVWCAETAGYRQLELVRVRPAS